MNKKSSFLFGFIVLLVTVIFTVAGCDNGTTGNNNDDDDNNTHLLQGSFASQNGGSGNAVFTANYKSSENRSVARAVAGLAATEKELVGKIEDGALILNLTGFHDTESNQFFLSAGSSFLVYEIGGTLSGGSMSNAEATVKIKDNDNKWTKVSVAVSNNSDDVEIAGTASAEQEEGLPVAWFGKWYDSGLSFGDSDPGTYCTLTGFNLAYEVDPEYEPFTPQTSFVNVRRLSDAKYQVITFTPEYVAGGHGGLDPETGEPIDIPVIIPATYSIK
jgi:hypothetical protein